MCMYEYTIFVSENGSNFVECVLSNCSISENAATFIFSTHNVSANVIVSAGL